MKKVLAIALLLATAACSGTQVGQQPRVSDQKLGYGTNGTVEVKTGDTVYSIARRHNVPMSAIIAANGLKAPYVLQPGQTINLPEGEVSNINTVSQLPYDRSVGAVDTYGANSAPVDGGFSDAPVSMQPLDGAPAPEGSGRHDMVLTPTGPVTTPAPGEEVISSTPTSILPETDGASAKSAAPVAGKPGLFKWPVQGPVMQAFDPASGGIAITAPKGTAVQSAAGGTVVQAGKDSTLGNAVVIQHPDGYSTVYGHLDRVLVEKDSIVGNGDAIGTVGQTGGVKSPQLHFEIRQGNQAADPALFLPAKG